MSQTPDVSGVSANTGPIQIPMDGAFFNVDGTQVVVYDLGNGIKVYYDFSSPGTQVDTHGAGIVNISAADFYAAKGPGWSPTSQLIHGGIVQKLAGILQGKPGTTFHDFMTQQLNTLSGGRQDWQQDPQIRALLTKRALGLIDDATLEVNLKGTDFWKTHTTRQNDWANISPADQQQRIQQEQMALQRLYGAWGVPAGDLTGVATEVASGVKTEEQVLATLQQQATVLYPWMADFAKQGTDTKTAAQPWLSTYSTVMEKPADLMNRDIQKALTSGTPVYQFETDLKKKPEWLDTKNAVSELTSAATNVASHMGMTP